MTTIARYLIAAGLWLGCLTAAFSQAQYGISVYPNFSGARLAASSTLNQRAVDSIEAREISKPSYSLGLVAQWRGQKAGFRIGLQYMDTGYRSVREPVPPGANAPEEALNQQVIYRNINLELPAELLFIHALSDKDRLNFMMGFSAAYILQNREDYVFFSGERLSRQTNRLQTADLNRLQLAFQTGVGFQRDLGGSVAIFVQPTFQFWYTALLQPPAEANRNLYSVGLKTGILFQTNNN